VKLVQLDATSVEMTLCGEQQNTHGKVVYKNLKFTQLYRRFKIIKINGYNMFGKWIETDWHT
jgi:hypothetical protein